MSELLGEWAKLAKTLDDDERLIYPDMYLENQHLYDKISGIGYLIKDLSNPDEGLDWVSSRRLNKLLRTRPNVAVITKLLIVRLRLPWNDVNTEWLIGKKELEENRGEYEVLDKYLRVRPIGSKEKPTWLRQEDKTHFEENPDDYEVVEIRYSVRYRWSEAELDELREAGPLVDKENVHTYLAE